VEAVLSTVEVALEDTPALEAAAADSAVASAHAALAEVLDAPVSDDLASVDLASVDLASDDQVGVVDGAGVVDGVGQGGALASDGDIPDTTADTLGITAMATTGATLIHSLILPATIPMITTLKSIRNSSKNKMKLIG